ncbi:hypothetical protein BSK65_10720 [Paenibacillus odorifer]|uniref:Uncharacterized protein n=1 Tax=Paenibacillus odorifer TaxID=189426 RepID=A0A1R0ZJK6_9BACL|nr:hypothetical protein [Paenibacillus odorifer]OME71505.1 hypothetical protein BSK65_10720 [Paenibacillus odorifer]
MLLRHVCEVCQKEDILSADQSFIEGWDYRPKIGSYGVVSPRTCGSCSIVGSLWWAMTIERKQIDDLSERQLETLNRILNEPHSIAVPN